jgi:hypothetical protein
MDCTLPSNVRAGISMRWFSLQSISLKDQGQFREKRKLIKEYCAADSEILL